MDNFGQGMGEDLELEFETFKDAFLLKIKTPCNIDLYNCRSISEKFKEKNQEKTTDWILDLSNVKFIDSSGLGVLATQANIISSAKKKIYILSPKSTVSHLFTMTGFSRWFVVVNKLDEIE